MDFTEEIVVQGVTAGLALGLLAVLLLLLPLAIPRLFVRRRRHFWCATARERVDVEFEERGLPGFRNAIAVLSCSQVRAPKRHRLPAPVSQCGVPTAVAARAPGGRETRRRRIVIPELRELLTREGAPFEVIGHREVYTAQERAAACHVPGRRLAKVVIVRDGDWYAMAVLPATARLDLPELRRRSHRYDLTLASEDELERLFPGCEIGAMPPFGRVFGLPVYLDRGFAAGVEMVFESGTHREEISMPMAEYIRVERPAITPLARVPLAA